MRRGKELHEDPAQRLGPVVGRHQGRKGLDLDRERCPEVLSRGFASRFEGKPGSNPEELLGAAHAACFTMALSLILGEAELTATQIDTTARVTLEQVGRWLGHQRRAVGTACQGARC